MRRHVPFGMLHPFLQFDQFDQFDHEPVLSVRVRMSLDCHMYAPFVGKLQRCNGLSCEGRVVFGYVRLS